MSIGISRMIRSIGGPGMQRMAHYMAPHIVKHPNDKHYTGESHKSKSSESEKKSKNNNSGPSGLGSF